MSLTVVSSVINSSISVTTSIQIGQVRSFFTWVWEREVERRQRRRTRTLFIVRGKLELFWCLVSNAFIGTPYLEYCTFFYKF